MNPIDSWNDYLGLGFVFLGCGFAMVAALGLWRMKNVYARLHCTTKAGTLGAVLVVMGLGVHTGSGEVWLRCLVLLTFLLVTGPVAGHAIARGAWLAGMRPPNKVEPNKETEAKPT